MTDLQDAPVNNGEEPPSSFLPRNILTTRNARIEAEKRLLEYDTIARHANLWCACLTATLSMLTAFSKNDCLAFVSAASAVILAITIFYASSRNYAAQAARMKACYTELQGLSIEASRLLFEQDKDDLEDRMADLGQRYVEVLKRTDNQTTKDYLRAVKDKKTQDQTSSEAAEGQGGGGHDGGIRKVLTHNGSFYIGMVLVYVLPLALLGLLAGLYTAVV